MVSHLFLSILLLFQRVELGVVPRKAPSSFLQPVHTLSDLERIRPPSLLLRPSILSGNDFFDFREREPIYGDGLFEGILGSDLLSALVLAQSDGVVSVRTAVLCATA